MPGKCTYYLKNVKYLQVMLFPFQQKVNSAQILNLSLKETAHLGFNMSTKVTPKCMENKL